MQDEINILRDVSGKLDRSGLDWMLTGSMAMNYYAQPRMTRDIDLVVALAQADTEIILSLFQPEYYVAREAVAGAIADESLFNIIHNQSVIKVDFIVRKHTLYRRAEFERRRRVALGDFSTWIVSKEDLILSKLDWAKDSLSEQQFRDVRNLVDTGCDKDYISHWAKEMGLDSLWGSFNL